MESKVIVTKNKEIKKLIITKDFTELKLNKNMNYQIHILN